MKKILIILFLLGFVITVQAQQQGDVLTPQQVLNINTQNINLQCHYEGASKDVINDRITQTISCLNLEIDLDEDGFETGNYKIIRSPKHHNFSLSKGLECIDNNGPLFCLEKMTEKVLAAHAVWVQSLRDGLATLQLSIMAENIDVTLPITDEDLN